MNAKLTACLQAVACFAVYGFIGALLAFRG